MVKVMVYRAYGQLSALQASSVGGTESLDFAEHYFLSAQQGLEYFCL